MFEYNGLMYKVGPRKGLLVFSGYWWQHVSRPSKGLEAAKRAHMVRLGLVHPAWLEPFQK